MPTCNRFSSSSPTLYLIIEEQQKICGLKGKGKKGKGRARQGSVRVWGLCRCGRGAGESGSLPTEHSVRQTPTAKNSVIFFAFFSSSIHEKEVRKLLISFHGGQPQRAAAPTAAAAAPFFSPPLTTCVAILMKINMPLVGVAAYDFDICRHFALPLPASMCLSTEC